MTKAKKKPSKSKSHQIQFRWNEENELTGTALENLEWYKSHDKNFKSVGQLLAESLNKYRGTPIPKRASSIDIMKRLSDIESSIERTSQELANVLLNALGNMDLSQYVHVGSNTTLQDDLGNAIPQDVYQQMFNGVQGRQFDVD